MKMISKEEAKELVFYHQYDGDVIWWVDNGDTVKGERLFTFDKQKIFNLFSDYPWKLTKNERELFDKENPYWADFFKDRK